MPLMQKRVVNCGFIILMLIEQLAPKPAAMSLTAAWQYGREMSMSASLMGGLKP